MTEREYAMHLIQFALASSVSIGIAAKTPLDEKDSFRSATGALVRIKGAPFLVTNSHVLDAYRTFAAERETQFFFADTAIDPIPRIYSENAEVDLALLAVWRLIIRPKRFAGVPNIQLFESDEWPPAAPQKGDHVFFAGWPEIGRAVDVRNMEATFRPHAYVGATVSDLTGNGFTIDFDPAKFRGVTGNEIEEQIRERDLTGLSGAPVFRDNSANGRGYELIGFIKEHVDRWNTLFATSALNIRAEDLKIAPYVA